MIIAVNTRFLLKNNLEGYGYFIKEIFQIITAKYSQHQFYFLFDRPYDESFIFSANVHPLVLSPPARHPILWKYWFDVKIPIILKKIKADVFVSPDGYCSLTTKIPQCLVVHDLGFLHHPEAYKKAHYRFYKYYTPKFLNKAKIIATVSQFSKKDILKNYKIDEQKIQVIYSASKKIFRPVSAEQKIAAKDKYTEGKEFFIYVGALQPRKNLVNLLKAFSIFKKRQKSEMKLVLAGRLAWKNDAFLHLLKTYKYKKDVMLTDYVDEEELVQLTGASYAMVYPSFFEGFGVPVLEGMNCEIPVLTSGNTSMQEVGEDAALYFNPDDYEDMAAKLMHIYKDEDLRKRLIEKGKSVAEKYSWEQTAALLWQSILKARNA